jgi:dolichol-phosphate mannosyltransferase
LAALLLLVAATVLRLWYGAAAGLAEDETYYWQWSRHPALSYYEQGPGIAWLIWLGTLVAGHTELGVRLGAILLAAGTGWLVFLTARRWFDERVALWTVVLLTITPLFAVGSMLATYDGPQTFFWAAALYGVTRTLQEDRAGGWYLVGLLVGFGVLCKITMLLFAPCLLLFLLMSPRYRRWLATRHPYVALVVALTLYGPVVLWNARHEWVGFRHMFMITGRSGDLSLLCRVGDFLGGQALALSPLLFLAELHAVFHVFRPGSRRRAQPLFERLLLVRGEGAHIDWWSHTWIVYGIPYNAAWKGTRHS